MTRAVSGYCLKATLPFWIAQRTRKKSVVRRDEADVVRYQGIDPPLPGRI
jgi:hypothetical protein